MIARRNPAASNTAPPRQTFLLVTEALRLFFNQTYLFFDWHRFRNHTRFFCDAKFEHFIIHMNNKIILIIYIIQYSL